MVTYMTIYMHVCKYAHGNIYDNTSACVHVYEYAHGNQYDLYFTEIFINTESGL